LYIACRPIRIEVQEAGKSRIRVIQPGEPVLGVEHWGYPTIIAHLNLEFMKWQGELSAAPHEAHKQARGVVIPAIFRKMAPRGPSPSATEGPEQAPTRAPDEAGAPASPGVFECPDCPGKSFKSAKALQGHAAAKHRVPKQSKAG
jgi:hypothetical protein